MDYENFKEQFALDVKDRLAEQGADVKVSVNEVNKLNESYEAITVTPEGSKKKTYGGSPKAACDYPLYSNFSVCSIGRSYEDEQPWRKQTMYIGFEGNGEYKKNVAGNVV